MTSKKTDYDRDSLLFYALCNAQIRSLCAPQTGMPSPLAYDSATLGKQVRSVLNRNGWVLTHQALGERETGHVLIRTRLGVGATRTWTAKASGPLSQRSSWAS